MKVPRAIRCGTLRVAWQPCVDRAAHRVELASASASRPSRKSAAPSDGDFSLLIESLEALEPSAKNATAERAVCSAAWPPSPPLKEWHSEPRGEGWVSMGVGLAGRTHWSAALELKQKKVPGALSLENDATHPDAFFALFDIAARVSEEPRFLGSHYCCGAAYRQIDTARGELVPGVHLCCDPATTRLQFDKSTGTLLIAPLPIAAGAAPQTIRWRYWIEQV